MNAVRTHRLLRFAVVITAMVAWFTLTNHCALADLIKSRAQAEHRCCQKTGEQPVEAPKEGDGSMECCKSVHATPPDVTPTAKIPPVLGEAWLALVTIVFARDEVQRTAETDTGPPRALSFTELVLNRSLLAHAPPRLA